MRQLNSVYTQSFNRRHGGRYRGLGIGVFSARAAASQVRFAISTCLKRFGGSLPKRRTDIEVGNVGDVPSVCFAVEDIDMVVLHGSLRLIASSAPQLLESSRLSILVMRGLPVREENGPCAV